jgi:hypothetical protein
MTVCIAAHAIDAGTEALVLCTDLMVGDDVSTSESVFKCDIDFGEGLCAMISGTVEDARDLVGLFKKRLGFRALAMRDLQEELRVGMQEFKSDLRRIGRKSQHDVQLLVCGFVEGRAVIIYIDNGEKAKGVSPYATIGSGGWCAETMLRWRYAKEPLDPFSNLSDVIYRVYEAKRFGELSPHVGTLTEMMIVAPSPLGHLQIDFLPPQHIDFLAHEFERYGPHRLPQNRQQFPCVTRVI